MTRKRLSNKFRSDILEAWYTLMYYADQLNAGMKVNLDDTEALVIGQIMNASDRKDWMQKLTALLRHKAKRIYTFKELHDLIMSERELHEELKNDLKNILSHLPELTTENINDTVSIPISDLVAIKSKMLRLN